MSFVYRKEITIIIIIAPQIIFYDYENYGSIISIIAIRFKKSRVIMIIIVISFLRKRSGAYCYMNKVFYAVMKYFC